MNFKALKFAKFVGIAALAIAAASCSTPKDIVYFQDVAPGQEIRIKAMSQIKIQPTDKLVIVVGTQDQRLSQQFNMPIQSMTVGGSEGGGNRSVAYTVNSYGDIDFPVLGEIHVAGLTREQVAVLIKDELISRDLIKDPVVTVEYQNLGVTVLGEVNSPGRYPISRDNYTLLEAIGQAGDLTINGKRENVMVIREEAGMQKVYEVNLLDANGVYTSPVFFLKQNDLVYVEPNKARVRQSTVNGNTALTYGFWMSTISFVVSMALIFTRI